MWMSHPDVSGVVTVADTAFYGGWDTLGWVADVAPVGPPQPDAGWPVSEGEVLTLVGQEVAAQLPAAAAAAIVADQPRQNATFARGRDIAKAGSRGFVFCGDSNTALGTGAAATVLFSPVVSVQTASWAGWAVVTGAGRWHLTAIAAQPSITPATWRITHMPAVIAAAPYAAVEMLGTNGSDVLATQITELTAIYDALDAAGIRVIVCSIPPRAAAVLDTARLNTWKQATARARGYIFVDNYATLVDPATGGLLAAYDTGDGTHFNAAGAKVVGIAFNTVINAALSDVSMLAKAQPAPALLINKPLVLVKSGFVPEDWFSLGFGSVSGSVDTVAGVVGKMWSMTQTVDGAVSAGAYVPLLADLIPGHRYRVEYKYALTVVGTAPTMAKVVMVVTTGGGTGLCFIDILATVPLSTVSQEFVCPVLSGYNYQFRTSLVGGGVGTKMQVGQITVTDLTLAGLA